jgi:hypothetical protein
MVGFNDKTKRLQFKAEWKLNNQQRQNMSLTNNSRIDIGIDIAEKNHDRRHQGAPPLQMVQRGTIVTALSNDNHDQQHT